MNPEAIAGLVGAGLFVIVVIIIYNTLVRRRYAMRSSWADIDVHLRKRHELVPNLVETVQGYVTHERETLARVTEIRSAAMRAQTPTEKARAEGALSDILRSLLVQVEAYPSLKADAHFETLMKQLREIEDGIEYARRFYNANTRDYNIAIRVFPSNIVAGTFGFAEGEFFALTADSKEREAPRVGFRSTPEGTGAGG